MSASPIKNILVPQLETGHLTKKQAAELVVRGVTHIHSSSEPTADEHQILTVQSLSSGSLPIYSWEMLGSAHELSIFQSGSRHENIEKIVTDLQIGKKRFLREKVELVLEELLSNAIFHPNESDFKRTDKVKLTSSQRVWVKYQASPQGIFLSVCDSGGRLKFEQVRDSFKRCYLNENPQIQEKESGAGLGLYMVFDSVTHLKVELVPGNSTAVSCWISDKRSFDPEYFSFNYFERS